jgi:peptidoglycan/LPS O-acetylase OafA/YrhL
VRLHTLDGLRAIAVVLTICFHFWQEFSGSRDLVGRLFIFVDSTTDLFFVLSGFLITGTLLRSQGEPGFLGRFYLRRVLRTFPIYYAMLAVIHVVLPSLGLAEWTPLSKSVWFWTQTRTSR